MPADYRSRFAIALAALALSTCGGDSPPTAQTKSFVSSACKKEQVAQSTTSLSPILQVLTDTTGLDGLSCVAWQRAGAGQLKLDLYNYENACGTTWSGTGSVLPDGSLQLVIANPSCTIANCAKCLYDWSFDLDVNLATAVATPLDVQVGACPGQQAPTSYPATTIGPADGGVHCTFADYGALNEQAAMAGTCGKAGWPCVGSLFCGTGSFASTGTCDPGLVCDSSSGQNEPRCLVPCTTVADCPRADAWACLSGLCRPAPS